MNGRVCLRHADQPAVRLCDMCGDPLCQACTISEGLNLVCRRCANDLQEKRAIRRILMVVLLFVLTGVALAGAWAWQERERFLPEPEVVIPPPDYGTHGPAIRRHRDKLAVDPCNKTVAKQLADRLNRARAYEETVAHVISYEEQCGVWYRLLWGRSYAHRQLRQWDEVGAVTTRLVESEPDDPDFWWWRARARGEAGDLDRAEADLRQSSALGANGYAELRFSRYLGDTNPCGAAFALQRWIEHGDANDRGIRKRTQHYVEGGCEAFEGRGRATIKGDETTPVRTVEVTVGEATGTFALDETSGYVVLTKGFAERAGVRAPAPVDPIYTLGVLLPGTTGIAPSVEVGKAEADLVAIAVVDGLPGTLDGVLGVSFLWRFEVDSDPKQLTIRAR